MVEVEPNAPLTLHRSTAAQEHRLMGKLQSLEGHINKATGMVRGRRGRMFKVAKGQNLDLVPIEVLLPWPPASFSCVDCVNFSFTISPLFAPSPSSAGHGGAPS
jgi:hypothetical protein